MSRTALKVRHRRLLEQVAASTSPLKVDEARGIIYRVKVLGRFSKNSHGMEGAENGTEYSLGAMKGELALLEGRKVKTDHPPDRANPAKERLIEATFGVLRNCVIESDESGEPAIWADFHCLTSHPMYPRVLEDVKKGLGVYGLSHNAAASRERFDRATKRLVIEEIAIVRSVDLVDKPATNRNLWESERPVQKTFRQILESFVRTTKVTASKGRSAWGRRLLEDDSAAMDAPADMGEAGVEDAGDAEDALWGGFQAAIDKILDSYKTGECDAKEAGKKIMDWIKAHEKLTGSDEPEEPVEESEESGPDGKPKKDALEGVGDGSKNQKGQKGAMEFYDAWDRKSRNESVDDLAQAFAEKKARELCESLSFTPSQLQVEAIVGVRDDKKRRALIESWKGPGGGFRAPRSIAPGSIDRAKAAKKAAREVVESDAADDLAALRNE